ncbi:MAG: rod shape-determining protein MreD [Bacteroidales bacterium]|nr:MAG: rod shape-determining protein MreD [Bacteroidales bacterium]
MINLIPRNLLRFIILILFQVLVLNNIQFSGYVNPFLYVLFILLLPFETPGWLLLVSGFLLGMSIDIFSGTLGMHTTASVLMAYVRPYVLSLIAPRDGYESGTFPRLYYFGFKWFLNYTIILVFLHHLVLFYLEVFKLTEFFSTFLRVILSSFFSVTLVMLSQYIIYRK